VNHLLGPHWPELSGCCQNPSTICCRLELESNVRFARNSLKVTINGSLSEF